MDLAYIDILAKDSNGVEYVLVRQDLFDCFIDAIGKKTTDSEETVRVFLTEITEQNPPKKIWVGKGTEFAAEFKKLCKAKGIKLYSTTSETKAAFAEITKRFLEETLHQCMGDIILSQTDSIRYNTEFRKKFPDMLDSEECGKI